MMDEIPNWLVMGWAGGMLGLLWHVGQKLDELAKLLRNRNSN